VTWSKEDREKAIRALQMIRGTFSKGHYIPHDVYEVWLTTFKKISTEMVIVNAQGEIYLARRTQSPLDPYAGQLHAPGVVHLYNERNEGAWQRLVNNELGPDAVFDGPHFLCELENNEPVRGLLQMRIHMTRLITSSTKLTRVGRFYPVKEIPWSELVKSHREIVVPLAIANAKAREWIAGQT
jgi:hypothetical protein